MNCGREAEREREREQAHSPALQEKKMWRFPSSYIEVTFGHIMHYTIQFINTFPEMIYVDTLCASRLGCQQPLSLSPLAFPLVACELTRSMRRSKTTTINLPSASDCS